MHFQARDHSFSLVYATLPLNRLTRRLQTGVSKTDAVALPQSAEKRKTVHSVMKIICREKKKQLAVLDTCNDHENYTQHSYRFFFSLSYKPSLYPQRVVS